MRGINTQLYVQDIFLAATFSAVTDTQKYICQRRHVSVHSYTRVVSLLLCVVVQT